MSFIALTPPNPRHLPGAFALVLLVLSATTPLPTAADEDDPDQIYAEAFARIEEAKTLHRAGQTEDAVERLRSAANLIESIREQRPEWNEAMTGHRLRRVRQTLAEWTGETGPSEDAAELVPLPDAMVADGIPPIPLALARDAERYLEFRAASFLDWHPQERRMLIRTRFADTAQLHQVGQPLGARRQLTFGAEPVRGAQYHPEHGDYLLYSGDVGGGEFYQIYRFDPTRADRQLLTDGESRNTSVAWSPSGQRLVFSSTRRNGVDTDLWLMDPEQPDNQGLLVELRGGGWAAQDWSPDETRVVVLEYVSVTESHLHLVDLESSQMTLLTDGLEEPATHRNPRFSADGESILAISNADSEFNRLVRINLDDGERTVLSGDLKWDVERFEPSQEGDRLAVVINEDGFSKLRILSADDGREIHRADLPPAVLGGPRWSADDKRIGFTMSAAQAGGDAWSIDTVSGETTAWTASETGGMDPGQFSEPELIRTPSFDDLEISSLVYRPDPERHPGPRPVLIRLHGGPESQARPGFIGKYNYYIDELGCAVIMPNVRGSSGYGKTFVSLDNGLLREDSVRDVGAVLDWIATQPDLDASRVAVIGGSYGGYMVLGSLMHFGDRLACGINIVGISSFVTFLENTQGYRRDLRRVEYGDERDPRMRAHLEKISPLNNLDRITRPLLVVHGANDPRVPRSEADQLVAGLRERGREAWYLLALNEGHGFRRKVNADYQFLVQIEFLRRHLLAPATDSP